MDGKLRSAKTVPSNLSWDIRLQRAYASFQKTVPYWYLLSVLLGVFVYTSKPATQDEVLDFVSFDDQYEQDTAYMDPYALTSLKKPTLFEDFPYEIDTTVLPIAPYKHVQERLDFKATTTIYLESIKNFVQKSTQNGGGLQPPVFNFHWKDFVDLNILKPLLEEKPSCFRIGALGSTMRIPWSNCLDEPQNLGFVFITPSLEPETEFRLSIRGKAYLYTAAPLPNKLIFLAGELAFVTKVGKRLGLDESTMIEEYVQRKLKEHPTLKQEQIIKAPITPSTEVTSISKVLDRELINFHAEKQDSVDVDRGLFNVQSTKERAQLANAARHNDDRHFRNVNIKSKDGKWSSEEYYDWRFFNKKLNNLNKRISLHGLIESYLQLCTNLGITTWIAGESMTSWHYNGLMGPWEDTVKFELPAADLSRIANSFNYSLIVSDPRNGTGSYLVDISPWYLERARYNDGGAAPDASDGRIIDTKTGIYIELSGVIQAPRAPLDLVDRTGDEKITQYVVTGKVTWYLPELLPLNRTLYEGKLANVPNTIPEAYVTPPEDYIYRDHLRLFADRGKCSYVPEEEKSLFDLTYIGCCHDNMIWKEYNSTKAATMKFFEVNNTPINVLDEVDLNF